MLNTIVNLINIFVHVAMPHILYKGVKGHSFQIIPNAEYISWHLVWLNTVHLW